MPAILALLGTKIVAYIIAFLVVAALVVGGYFYWKHEITVQAQATFNAQQLAQKAKDDASNLAQANAIIAEKTQAVEDLTKQNADLNAKLKDVDDYLNSAQATKDSRESSAVLKTTINKLRKATSSIPH